MRSPFPVTPVSKVSAGCTAWRHSAATRVTVVAKATFRLVDRGNAELIEPEPLVDEDRYTMEGSTRVLAAANEAVPYLPGASILVAGHAYAPGGVAVPSMSVKLSVHRQRALVDKTLHVYGDRASPTSAPAPFVRMPLSWSRARRGGGDNPAGTDTPNFFDPNHGARPAGLGPIAPDWPSRRRLFGSFSPEALQVPFAEIPDGFDWRALTPAPPDQVVGYLSGDEWLVLDGLDAASPRLVTRLPGLRAVARAHLQKRGKPIGPPLQVALIGDMLLIDTDRRTAALVYRGSFALADMSLSVRVQVAAHRIDEPVHWVEPTQTSTATAALDLDSRHGVPSTPFVKPSDVRPAVLDLLAAPPAGSPAGRPRATAPAEDAPPRSLPFEAPPLHSDPPRPPPPAIVDEPSLVRLEAVASTVRPHEVLISEGRPDGAIAHQAATIRPGAPDVPPAPVDVVIPRAIPGAKPGPSLELEPIPSTARPSVAIPGGPIVDSDARRMVVGKLEAGQALYDAQLASCDLRGLDLSNRVLSGCNLSDADLRGCTLEQTRLSGARLDGADLSNVTLSGADLTSATLRKAKLSGANLSHALLTDSDFTMAHGEGAVFDGAKGRGVRLAQAEWARASFKRCDLPGVDLEGAALDHADFDDARLVDSRFAGARGHHLGLRNADATRANVENATFTAGDFDGADFSKGNFAKADLSGSSIAHGRLDECDLSRAILSDARLTEATLQRANLRLATAERADLTSATLDHADLRQAKLVGAQLGRARLRGVNASKVDLSDARLVGADLSDAVLRPAKLVRADLAHAKLFGTDLRDADLTGANLHGVDQSTAKMRGANLTGVRDERITDPPSGAKP